MAKREWLMLAHKFDEKKHSAAGWFMSEKLDGLRMLWDGGITRGMPVKDIPFANTEKDYRFVNQNLIATGLWSRGGKIIHAPDWWLNALPPFPLDGEAYAGRGNFQLTASIIKDMVPGNQWYMVKFHIFDSPLYTRIFGDGEIDFKSHKKTLRGVYSWAKDLAKQKNVSELALHNDSPLSLEFLYKRLCNNGFCNHIIRVHPQTQLPYNRKQAADILEEKLAEICAGGGEGIMLRKPESVWVPERTYSLLKVKALNDAEAEVVGYTWGRRTDKGSKLLGLMGALVVKWNGKIFELSGFTDKERFMAFKGSGNTAEGIGRAHPGERCNHDMIHNPQFPIGSKVTFQYRDLTNDGLPKEARYFRKYTE